MGSLLEGSNAVVSLDVRALHVRSGFGSTHTADGGKFAGVNEAESVDVIDSNIVCWVPEAAGGASPSLEADLLDSTRRDRALFPLVYFRGRL
jgi:hypothetical protein